MRNVFSYDANNLWTYVFGEPISASDSAADEIRSFAHLPKGWDYGKGGPIDPITIKAALEWNNYLRAQRFTNTRAFPGGGGEIVIAAGEADHYLEVIVEPGPEPKISVAYDFQRKQVFYRLRKAPEEARQSVLEIAGQISWSASILPTHANIMQTTIGGPGRPSRIMAAHYQLSDVTVLEIQGLLSANTFINISRSSEQLPASHPFFGSSKQTSFQQEEV